MDDDSIDRQIVADARYRQSYLEWIQGLSAADRAALECVDPGLTEPLAGYSGAAAPLDLNVPDPQAPWHEGQPLEDDELDADDCEKIGAQADAVAALLRVVILPAGMRGFQPQAALVRLVALAHCLHVPGVGNRSLESLAEQIGCTRALLCNYIVKIRDFAKLDCYAGKSITAREAQSSRALWKFRTKIK